MSQTKKWMGEVPVACQLCGTSIGASQPAPFNQFVDGKTLSGSWGLLCVPCHEAYGCGLGTGRGQKYNAATLDKVEG